MADLFTPATRRTDPETSHAAAEAQAATVGTIRGRVLAMAQEKGSGGFIDDDLVLAWSDHPESSFRKRRTELFQEGYLVDSGRTRTNRWGNQEVIWTHRDFAVAPPPLKERAAPRQLEPLRAEGRAMAQELAGYAVSLKAEGRMVHSRIAEAARIMRELAR